MGWVGSGAGCSTLRCGLFAFLPKHRRIESSLKEIFQAPVFKPLDWKHLLTTPSSSELRSLSLSSHVFWLSLPPLPLNNRMLTKVCSRVSGARFLARMCLGSSLLLRCIWGIMCWFSPSIGSPAGCQLGCKCYFLTSYACSLEPSLSVDAPVRVRRRSGVATQAPGDLQNPL